MSKQNPSQPLKRIQGAKPDSFFEWQLQIDQLARGILQLAHEAGLSIQDIGIAAERCRKFAMNTVAPLDERNEVSQID